MKVTVKIVAAAVAFACTMPALHAQNRSTVRTVSPKEEKNELSVRAQSLYDKAGITEADIPWMRVIYRSVDLTKEKNMPLYYPEESMENQENMFRLIVRLMADGKVPVYEYLDGREIFTEAYQLKVKDVLDRYHIPYEEKQGRASKTVTFGIEDSDIPTNEVLSYYMREKWVFDQRNSKFYPIVEALCPVLHRAGDFGGEAVKYPMFWVRYNDIKPYLSQQYILTNNENNVQHYTFDDYFQLRLFEGEIYKTTNLRNMSLMQMYPSDTARVAAQTKIENQLKNFENNLWVKMPEQENTDVKSKAKDKDSSDVKEEDNNSKKEQKTTVSRSARSSRGTVSKSKSSSKSSKVSRSSSRSTSKSAPVRSVRRTK